MAEEEKNEIYEFHYGFLLSDFILRCLVLAAYRFDYIEASWFWALQIALIPLIIFILAIINSPSGEVKSTTGSVLTSLFILFSGVYIAFDLMEDIHIFLKFINCIGIFIGYGFYILMIYFSSGKKPRKEKKEKLSKVSSAPSDIPRQSVADGEFNQSVKSENIESQERFSVEEKVPLEKAKLNRLKKLNEKEKEIETRKRLLTVREEERFNSLVSDSTSPDVDKDRRDLILDQLLESAKKEGKPGDVQSDSTHKLVQPTLSEKNIESSEVQSTPSKKDKQSSVPKKINTDLNDADIVKLEGTLHYTNDRVNSYILESALFSGLAFAGFITLMASDKVQISEISNLLNSIAEMLNSLINFDLSSIITQLTAFSQEDLFVVILIESLFCTLAFISVIASRLRFSDILQEIEISVKMARSFNYKEEEAALAYMQEPKDNYMERISYLNKKIEKEISIANKKFASISPILNTIRIVRSFGMIFFFSMIFTSALLINSVLAFFVLLATILVTIIMNVDHSLRIKKLKKLNKNYILERSFKANRT